MTASNHRPKQEHRATILDQFTRQAEFFASAHSLHDRDALDLLVNLANPGASDVSLDVACGPGSVVLAFAKRVRCAVGLDATAAMLEQARQAAAKACVVNVEWHLGDVYALPFADGTFNVVSCRFAFHHLQEPERAFAEMVRVASIGGRIVLCDAVAPDDSAKAGAFNRMERFRDPSTVEFRPLAYLIRLFAGAGLREPVQQFYQIPVERERLIAGSFPAGEDRAGLRAMLEAAIDGDLMGVGARRQGDSMWFDYSAAVLAAVKEQ